MKNVTMRNAPIIRTSRVSEIHEAHRAIDDREAERDQGVHRSDAQAPDGGLQKLAQVHG